MNRGIALVFRAGVVPFHEQVPAFLLGEKRLQVVTSVRVLGDGVQGSGVVTGDGFDLFARQCLALPERVRLICELLVLRSKSAEKAKSVRPKSTSSITSIPSG